MEYRLENWSVVVGEINPYMAPEQVTQHLHGKVYSHPLFDDGDEITTTAMVARHEEGDNVVIETRTGSRYLLGEVDPAYEAAFPNARARVGKVRS